MTNVPISDRTAELQRIDQATRRLLTTTASLTDSAVAAASLLPGWSRGHVLTHISRNADGLANLLRWARTGNRTPMYESREVRNADIEAGAGRSCAEQLADLRDSAQAFAAEAAAVNSASVRGAAVGGAAWDVMVSALAGDPFPAHGVLTRRLGELEIHHVDLAAGYGPTDWPGDFVAMFLRRVADDFSGDKRVPACVLRPAELGTDLHIGPDSQHPTLVSGPAANILAWLIGRGTADGLHSEPPGRPPTLPPWR